MKAKGKQERKSSDTNERRRSGGGMAEVPKTQQQCHDGDITAFVEALPPPPPPPPPPPSSPPQETGQEEGTDSETPRPREMVHLFMNGADVVLPFRPYPAQIAIMNNVTQAVREGGHVLVESATGTGKTLALLAAVLAARQRLLDLERDARVHPPEVPQLQPVQNSGETVSRLNISDDEGENGNKDHDDKGKDKDDDFDSDDDDFEQPTKRARDVVQVFPETAMARANTNAEKKGRGSSSKKTKESPATTTATTTTTTTEERGGVGRVFFCTRTHTQVAQVVKELKRLPYRVCAVALASREMYCLNRRVQRRADRDQACRALAAHHACPYEAGAARLAPWVHERRLQLDVEDLVALGRRWAACPSLVVAQLQRRGAADVLVGPYNYVVDPLVRASLGLSLANAVVVVDEAHNLPGALTDALSATVDLVDLADAARAELEALVPHRPAAEALLAPVRRVLQWARDRVAALPATAFETHANAWSGEDARRLFEHAGLTEDSLESLTATLAELSEDPATPDGTTPHSATRTFGRARSPRIVSTPTVRQGKKSGLGEHGHEHGEKHSGAHGDEHGEGDENESTKENKQELGKTGWFVNKSASTDTDATATGTTATTTKNRLTLRPRAVKVLESLLNAARFLFWDGGAFVRDFRLVLERKRASGAAAWEYAIGLWCMSPAAGFAAIARAARTVVLASGTLAPFDPLAHELRCDFAFRAEMGHVVDRRQVFAAIVAQYEASYRHQGEWALHDGVGQSLLGLCRAIPAGVLCFFPSFGLLAKMVARWRRTGLYDQIAAAKHGNVYSEEAVRDPFVAAGAGGSSHGGSSSGSSGTSKRAFARMVDNYRAKSGTAEGALLLTVCRGKASEGIDFADDAARGVVVVGVPYPSLADLRVALKREHENVLAPGGGDAWYALQGHRAVNQAVGRAIRHRWDYGAIVFLDARYARPAVTQQISKWVRASLRVVPSTEQLLPQLRQFFADAAAFVRPHVEQQQHQEHQQQPASSPSSSSVSETAPPTATDPPTDPYV